VTPIEENMESRLRCCSYVQRKAINALVRKSDLIQVNVT